VPTSSKTSNALAVKRCMSFKSCLDGVEKNRFQAQKSFRPRKSPQKHFTSIAMNRRQTIVKLTLGKHSPLTRWLTDNEGYRAKTGYSHALP
jgi:hypothetical protein